MRGVEVNTKTGGYTAVHRAVYNNGLESLQALLTIPGIDLNIKNTAGDTPIVDAYKYNIANIICVCLKDLEGSFEVPSGYGGCLRPRWACLPSSCQTKSKQYCGPNGPTASIFYGI